jgi:L-lactate dehydrogenase complex protein LldG
MSNDQTAFMTRLRQALGREQAPLSEAELFSSRQPGELESLLARARRHRDEQLELLDLLQQTAHPLNLKVHTFTTPDEAGMALATLATESETEWGGDKQIITHDSAIVDSLKLAEKLGDSIPVQISRLEDGEDEKSGKARLRQMAIDSYMGITGADWCVCDCAAIALMTGPGHGRAVSLVPSIHVAVIALDQLLLDLPELYAQLESIDDFPCSMNFISGPSKTADIEAQLVHGAHGPREMHLFIITG